MRRSGSLIGPIRDAFWSHRLWVEPPGTGAVTEPLTFFFPRASPTHGPTHFNVMAQVRALESFMFQVQTREGNPVSPLFSCYDLARKASWEIPGYRPEDLLVTPIDNWGVWRWDHYWGSWTASVPEGSREFFSGNSPHPGEGLVWADWLEEQGLSEMATVVRLWVLECSVGKFVESWLGSSGQR